MNDNSEKCFHFIDGSIFDSTSLTPSFHISSPVFIGIFDEPLKDGLVHKDLKVILFAHGMKGPNILSLVMTFRIPMPPIVKGRQLKQRLIWLHIQCVDHVPNHVIGKPFKISVSLIFSITLYNLWDIFYISIPVFSIFFRVPCWYSPTSLTATTSSTTSPTLTSSYSSSTSPPSTSFSNGLNRLSPTSLLPYMTFNSFSLSIGRSGKWWDFPRTIFSIMSRLTAKTTPL